MGARAAGEVPEGRGTVGAEELCHATDVLEMLSA